MMVNSKTYELKISLVAAESSDEFLKESVKGWLNSVGIESFVEGCVDDLDIDHRYDQNTEDYYDQLVQKDSPLIIYDYSLEYLSDIRTKLLEAYPELSTEITSMDSKVWMEGWRESFKPIYSRDFVIHPPWDKPEKTQRMPIEIEPGMAFGTGQHATTQVCLEMIEELEPQNGDKFLDVGTGTGVLAIAGYLKGYRKIVATDVDHAAVKASKANARINGANVEVVNGSVPTDLKACFDVVVANILFVVLERIIADLASATKHKGILILSGLLSDQKDLMLEFTKREGLTLMKTLEKDGWACLLLEKR